MTRILKTFISAAALTLGLSASANAYQPTPDVYVVFFEADWCGPCKIVEPRLTEALQNLRDPMIEFVPIDISGGKGDLNAHAVFDRGIVQQYNMWMGVTGFAAIIDGDTKRTMGCVNMTYDAKAMAMHIRNLQNAARNNQQSFDLTCPEPNNI
ncbi:thioredoxin domain-containing protein [Litorimonas sp. RW-G-Af-16]|uniref:thioredoxin family protein n=1 Tax=Litorimonas sp. RW-G-Af-16 TaxID=3241168 RepID=UPI00390C7DFD